jgi:hypothetical protein
MRSSGAPCVHARPRTRAGTAVSLSIIVVTVLALAGPLPRGAAAQGGLLPIEPACSAAPSERYWDVAGVHAPAIDCIAWWGVTTGVNRARYAPDRTITRGQMASFIARTIDVTRGELPAEPPDAFTDDDRTTHEPAINQLATAGVISGVEPGRFHPERAVTRAQMASFLANAWEARTGEPLPGGIVGFADVADDVHRMNIERIAQAGLTGGVSDAAYDPAGVVTRGQMGTFLARFVAKLVDEGYTTNPPDDPVPMPVIPVFASVGSVALYEPSPYVELTGFHEANSHRALQMTPASTGAPSLTLPSRGRGTGSRTAADVVADPHLPVLAPVSGRVLRAGSYLLYGSHPDLFIAIAPDGRSDREVVVLHFEGLRVRAGDRVEAGRTVIGDRPRVLPLRSQVDRYSQPRNWPHVHLEVRSR